MKTNYSRRDALTVAALGIIGGCATAQAQAQAPAGAKAPAADPKAIKTRVASCNCGQLRLTCNGPDPERISMCHCNNCQKQTGSPFSVQGTFPKEQVTIEGKSTAWKFPVAGAEPVTYRNCSRTGVTFHFCPTCGSTVYFVLNDTPENIAVKVGCFTDPTFPPPNISGFEEYKHPWALKVADLPMPLGHHQ